MTEQLRLLYQLQGNCSTLQRDWRSEKLYHLHRKGIFNAASILPRAMSSGSGAELQNSHLRSPEVSDGLGGLPKEGYRWGQTQETRGATLEPLCSDPQVQVPVTDSDSYASPP